MIKLTGWGAAKTTTGSFHLLDIDDSRIVMDCGLFQGRRSVAREYNSNFPCPAESVDCMVLSHAHIDHCGNIPTFVKAGYTGPIHCTNATEDLTRILLMDSAHIQEKDTYFVNKIRRRKGEPALDPLYTMQDVDSVLPLFQSINYYRPSQIAPGVSLRFLEAGHILGSAQAQLDIRHKGGETRFVFSGDIGRGQNSILRDPEIPDDADYLIMESTYGARDHEPVKDLRNRLRDLVKRVYQRRGKIIIPAFSVGRTQEIVYQLNNLWNDGELPRMDVYVDSPLSNNVTRVFVAHPECFNRDVRDILRKDPNVFGFETLIYTQNVDESKALNELNKPAVIISASGMCEAGRILHHLRNSIQDPKNCVLIVGFQAEHTLGRRIVEKRKTVRIFGEEHSLRAEVAVMDGFSAHADQNELREYAFRVKERGNKLKRVFLVHGEKEQQEPFASWLRESLGVEVTSIERGETYTVAS